MSLRTVFVLLLAASLLEGCLGEVTYRRVLDYPPAARGRRAVEYPGVHWGHGSVESARAEARRRGRPLMVYVETSWCGPCKRLKKHTFTDPSVVRLINERMNAVRVDGDSPEGKRLCSAFSIRSYPTLLFFDGQGREIDRAFGYREPAAMVQLVNNMLAGKDTVGSLRRRVAAAPQDASLRLQLGQHLAMRGDRAEARKQLDAVIAIDPRDERHFASRALHLRARLVERAGGQVDAAIDTLRTLLREYPRSPSATGATFDLVGLLARRRPDEALGVLAALVARAPRDAGILIESARAARRARLPLDRPIQWARLATTLRRDGWAWFVLADLYGQVGRRTEQLEALRQATQRSPGDRRYLDALERVRSRP